MDIPILIPAKYQERKLSIWKLILPLCH